MNILSTIAQLAQMLSGFECIDLAHTIERGMPKWPTHPQIVIDPSIVHEHDGYYCQSLVMGEHTGSHVDAPAHIIPSMMECTIETYPVDILFAPAVKYELWKLKPQSGSRITAAQILNMEKEMGDSAGEGEIVLLDFGWEQYWRTDRDWKYYATNQPGLAEDATKLFAERKVKAVGSDTVACDTPVKDGYEMKSYGHQDHWLPNHIFIMEMLRNFSKLPRRCYFIATALKIKNGSGSPIRPVALVPKQND